MSNSFLFDLILNISLLLLIANLLTKSKIVRGMLINKSGNLWSKIFLAIIFGLFCIFSTYLAIPLDGVLVNTRVIGALAGGIIGGPVVGIGAGLIGGIHRYLFDIHGFTSVACALSTFIAGIIGSVFFPYFQRGKWNEVALVALTTFVELIEMAMILIISQPFEIGLSVVKTITLPLIFINSFGMLIFISTFKNVFVEYDLESASKLSIALSIAEQSLPYIRKGLSSIADLEKVVSIILSSNICTGAIITDSQQILVRGQVDNKLKLNCFKDDEVPLPAKQAMEKQDLVIYTKTKHNPSIEGILKDHTIIAAPLIKMDKSIGCLIVFIRQRWLNLEADITFVRGLATLFSTQLELSELDNQKDLLRKAEFSALQSQINPHFLYNSLNTISCIVRENPNRARELIMIMATYFRKTLDSERYMISLEEEISHINNYLILEKSRFEDKLNVHIDIPEDVDCLVPTLILQPIVENAIKYGVDTQGRRHIDIRVRSDGNNVSVVVSDGGPGFPLEVIEDLNNGVYGSSHIGLSNVQRRLKSIYTEEDNLRIKSSGEGTQVELIFRDVK